MILEDSPHSWDHNQHDTKGKSTQLGPSINMILEVSPHSWDLQSKGKRKKGKKKGEKEGKRKKEGKQWFLAHTGE